jgi:hypothetical protein
MSRVRALVLQDNHTGHILQRVPYADGLVTDGEHAWDVETHHILLGPRGDLWLILTPEAAAPLTVCGGCDGRPHLCPGEITCEKLQRYVSSAVHIATVKKETQWGRIFPFFALTVLLPLALGVVILGLIASLPYTLSQLERYVQALVG